MSDEAQRQEDLAALEEQIVELSAEGQDSTRLWQIRDKLLGGSIE